MNDLIEKQTPDTAREIEFLKAEVASLKATVALLVQKLDSKEDQPLKIQPAATVLKTSTDTPSPVTDTPRSDTDTPRSDTDTPRFGTDIPRPEGDTIRAITDTSRLEGVTPSPGTDTPGHSTDTPGPEGDTPKNKTQSIGATDKSISGPVIINKNSNISLQNVPLEKKMGVVEILRKVGESKNVEITQLLKDWNSEPQKSYHSRKKITRSLEIINSYLSAVQQPLNPELSQRINEEKIVLTIKNEILTKLRRPDMVRIQIDRLVKEVIYIVQEPSPDMDMLKSKFRVHRMTVSRDLLVFRKIGWVKTIGRGPTAKYALTVEARSFISKMIGEYKS